jgi:hypothetical protein
MTDTTSRWFAHLVYFSLRDNSPAAIERLVASCREHLSGHSGTVLFAAGTRDPEMVRDVNDKQFDVALQLVFSSRAAHDAYQIDPRHAKFISENKANWASVRVFDAFVSE